MKFLAATLTLRLVVECIDCCGHGKETLQVLSKARTGQPIAPPIVGASLTFVKTASTSSAGWRNHIVSVLQNNARVKKQSALLAHAHPNLNSLGVWVKASVIT